MCSVLYLVMINFRGLVTKPRVAFKYSFALHTSLAYANDSIANLLPSFMMRNCSLLQIMMFLHDGTNNRLITPLTNWTILDPFLGSKSTSDTAKCSRNVF